MTTCSESVSPILVAAAKAYGDIAIKQQYQIYGRYGRGRVDFALEAKKTGETLGIVTEIKCGDIRKAIGQNLVQLESSLTGRNRKHSQISSDMDYDMSDATVYGIVTDYKEWYVLECIMVNENLRCRMSKPSKIDLEGEKWQAEVGHVFDCLDWLLGKMEIECRNRDP